ncbi:MAG: hypothetical protein R2697_10310 [Ilumatobacteraceae bacterium]
MALIERPCTGDLTPAVATPEATYGVRRPVESTGWKSWLFTIDYEDRMHRMGVTAMFFSPRPRSC